MNEDKFAYLSPELREEFESAYRKEKLLNNKILNDKQCVMCKGVSALLFAGAGAFHGVRVYQLWKFYPAREKVFNLVALGVLFGFSAANAFAGKEIYMGKNMMSVETRPSLL